MKKQIAVLCMVMVLCTLLTACKKEVAVDFSTLEHITADGAVVTMTTESYTATLTADVYYELPESVTVSVDGEVLTEGYTYDPSTGVLTIDGKSVTGEILVSAVAEESIVGSWVCACDMTDLLNESFAATGLGDAFQYEGFILEVNLVFNGDGTYALYLDEDSTKKALDSMMEQTEAFMLAYIEDTLAEQGLDVSIEEFLEFTGMDIDQLLYDEFGDDPAGVLMSDVEQSGRYVAEDGKVHLSSSETVDPDMEHYETYTIENGRLTLDAGNVVASEEMQGMLSELYPLVFERVTE